MMSEDRSEGVHVLHRMSRRSVFCQGPHLRDQSQPRPEVGQGHGGCVDAVNEDAPPGGLHDALERHHERALAAARAPRHTHFFSTWHTRMLAVGLLRAHVRDAQAARQNALDLSICQAPCHDEVLQQGGGSQSLCDSHTFDREADAVEHGFQVGSIPHLQRLDLDRAVRRPACRKPAPGAAQVCHHCLAQGWDGLDDPQDQGLSLAATAAEKHKLPALKNKALATGKTSAGTADSSLG